jgi:hypothetical protein
LDIKIAEIARHNLERFLGLRRVATLYLQALHALAELADTVLGFRDSLGDSEKSVAVIGHFSTLWIVVPAHRVQRVCVKAKKGLWQSKD